MPRETNGSGRNVNRRTYLKGLSAVGVAGGLGGFSAVQAQDDGTVTAEFCGEFTPGPQEQQCEDCIPCDDPEVLGTVEGLSSFCYEDEIPEGTTHVALKAANGCYVASVDDSTDTVCLPEENPTEEPDLYGEISNATFYRCPDDGNGDGENGDDGKNGDDDKDGNGDDGKNGDDKDGKDGDDGKDGKDGDDGKKCPDIDKKFTFDGCEWVPKGGDWDELWVDGDRHEVTICADFPFAVKYATRPKGDKECTKDCKVHDPIHAERDGEKGRCCATIPADGGCKKRTLCWFRVYCPDG